MAKQPLIELVRSGEGRGLRLIESDPKKLPKGVLATLEGVFGETESDTQNGRTYSNKLWRRQLDETDLKQRLSDKDVLGEADHPEGLESSITRISHVITDEWLDESNNLYYGRLDILDTPSGRIVSTLLEYGWMPGISSRGAGEIMSSRGRREIDPETYEYITHDLVIDPACRKARLSRVQESAGQVPLTEALTRLAETDNEKYHQHGSYDFYASMFKEKFDINLEAPTVPVQAAAGSDTDFLKSRISELSNAVESLIKTNSESPNMSVPTEAHTRLVSAYSDIRKELETITNKLQEAEQAKTEAADALDAIQGTSATAAESVKHRLSIKSTKLAEFRLLHVADRESILQLESRVTEAEQLHTDLLETTNKLRKEVTRRKAEIKRLKERALAGRKRTASTSTTKQKTNSKPQPGNNTTQTEDKERKTRTPRRRREIKVESSFSPARSNKTTESKSFDDIVNRVAVTVGKTASQ